MTSEMKQADCEGPEEIISPMKLKVQNQKLKGVEE
jgi:hypothetical protein